MLVVFVSVIYRESGLHTRYRDVIYTIVITRRHVVGILYDLNSEQNGVKLTSLSHGYLQTMHFDCM